MSKILLIDLDEASLQFAPAIQGKSDLNEAQAKRLAKKLVTLLEQNCGVKGAIQFEVHVGPWRFETGIVRRGVLIPVEDEKKFELGDKVTCFIFRKGE